LARVSAILPELLAAFIAINGTELPVI